MADKKNDSLLETARERFKLAEEATRETRKLAKEDLEFKAGIQWDERMRTKRENSGRPCLTINRIPQQVRQITNDQRQNRPSIRILPVSEGANVETAKVFQGIIRNIEYQSNAENVYDHAFEGAVDGGYGFYRLVTVYTDPKSFHQEARFKRIHNPNSVLLDPFSREPDGSDASWGFVFEDIAHDDFKAKYKDAELSKQEVWDQSCETNPEWVKKESCRVAEYFYKEYEDSELISWISDALELPEGVSLKKEFDSLVERFPHVVFEVIDTRQTQIPIVKWVKFAGDDVLEETTFPSQYIPIFPVYGTEVEVSGQRIFEGIIRHAKDPQRMYNFWNSSATEMIALAPKAPFILAEGQQEGYEDEWETANSEPRSALIYKPTTIDGQLAPPPQRNSYEPAVQAIMAAQSQAAEDIKATTGIYDAALGARSNEASGIAIQRRANQAQTSNFHFVDNLSISMKHAGRVLLEVIPVIYDLPRAQQIVGEDGNAEVIFINKPFMRNGKEAYYDLTTGKYDVVVEVGPGYATKRQESVAAMIEFVSAFPQAAQVLGDLLAKNMDWPGAQEISERLKKLIPPHILEDGNQQVPPQVQAQIAQMTQMIQTLQAQLQAAATELEFKQGQKQMEIASKERIEFAKMDVDLQKEAMKIPTPGVFENLMQQMAEINHRLQLVGINQPLVQPIPPQFQPNFNGTGPMPDQLPIEQQQPTGGLPGTTMGVMP